MIRFARNTFFSTALLSIASIGSGVGSCAMQEGKPESPQYKMAEERPRYCYNTLAEISCFNEPQENMGAVVALEAERIIPHEDAETAIDDKIPATSTKVPKEDKAAAAIVNEREKELQENLKAEETNKPVFAPSAPLDPRYYGDDGLPIPLTKPVKAPAKAKVKSSQKTTVNKTTTTTTVEEKATITERPAQTPAGASVAAPAPAPTPLAPPAQ
jgi:hypothetical protein